MKINNKMVFKKACAVILAVTLPLSLTGCMPYMELKNESIVEGMGIDYEKNQYNITFQIYNTQSSGGGGEEAKKSSGSGKVKILQSTGTSLFEAVRNATLQNGRKLYFSNIRAFIIGDEVSKNHFAELLDFMERNQQIKPTERIFAAKGKASDILSFKQDDEIVPAINIQQMAQSNTETSKVPDIELLDVFNSMASGLTDPVVTSISIGKTGDKKNIQLSGTAVIHNNKLAGYLDYNQTKGFMWITGQGKGGVVVTKLPQGGMVTSEIMGCSSKISVSGNEKKPVIDVSVKTQTNITEINTNKEYIINDKFLETVKNMQNEEIKKDINLAIKQALRTYDSDIFGFGKKIFEDKPEMWRKLSAKWSETVKNLNVKISVNSEVKHIGLTNKPTFPQKTTAS